MDALTYNRAQPIDPDTLARIQRTVGAVADGAWGPKTVAKIAAWQTEQGLGADGRVGPATLAKFHAAWELDDELEGDEGLDDLPDGDEVEIEVEPDAETLTLYDVQNALFAFGFEPGQPDGQAGAKTRAAVAAFQIAARGRSRVVDGRRIEVAATYTGGTHGELDAATLDEIGRWKREGFRWIALGASYDERRVRVENYGRMPRSSRLLVDVPGTGGKPRKLHRLAAEALARMLAAAKAEAGLELLVQSGWRAHRWASFEQYKAHVIKRYGSLKRGRKYLAYDSPHETGLAVDFGTEGLYPASSTVAKQRATPAHAWLVANAWRFGWHPYKAEPWHWEFPLSSRAWSTGESDWGD